MTSDAAEKKRVQFLGGWRYWLLMPVGWLMRGWLGTLRVRVDDEDVAVIEEGKREKEGGAVLIWHNRLFVAPYLYRRFGMGREIYALISASKDGAWLAALMKQLGVKAIRGSSSWRGRAALTELVRVIKEGGGVAITPDGPRGPCYEMKAGAVLAAKQAKAPIFLFGCNFSKAWRLRSWDGFYIPKPFSELKIRCRRYDLDEDIKDKKELASLLKKSMMEITEDI